MSPADKLMDSAEWVAIPGAQREPGGLPVPTHEGVLRIGSAELRCYQLDDGRRIIDADDVAEFFGGFR